MHGRNKYRWLTFVQSSPLQWIDEQSSFPNQLAKADKQLCAVRQGSWGWIYWTIKLRLRHHHSPSFEVDGKPQGSILRCRCHCLSFKISQSNKIFFFDEWQSNSWEQSELFERQINSDTISRSFSVLSQVNRTAKLDLLDWLSNGNVDENLTSTCASWQWSSMQRLLIYWYMLAQMIELRQAICIITLRPSSFTRYSR